MSFGIEVRNPDGALLIDGEHRMPKLHDHGRLKLTDGHYTGTYNSWRGNFDFPPTDKPILVTQALDETEPGIGMLAPYVFRNSQGQFYRVRLEAMAGQNYQPWVFVWVYEL